MFGLRFFILISLTMVKKFEKQILRLGKWNHPAAPNGILTITKKYCKKLADNFKVTPFAPITRGHVSNEELEKNPYLIISKNIKNLKVKDDGLYAVMEVDEKEIDKYNDVSVSIAPEYTNKETGKTIGDVIRHVAMVVNPYIKQMKPFVALSEDDGYLINLSEITNMKKIDKAEIKMEETEEVVEEVKTETAELDETVKVEAEEIEKEEVETPAEEETEVESDEESTKEETTEIEAEVEAEVEESEDEKEVEPEEEEASVEEVSEPEEAELSEKTSEELKADIVELQDTIEKQNKALVEGKIEKAYELLLSDGKIIPAQKTAFFALSEGTKGVIKLSDGSEKEAFELLIDLFDKSPVVVHLEEEGVDSEGVEDEIPTKLKGELREKHLQMSDKEFEKWFEKNKQVILEGVDKYK